MLLGPADLLPATPRKVLVNGTSGSGKTRLCRRIASLTGLPHTEIDALFHGAGWTPRPEFLDDVRAMLAQESWLTEWQYDDARPLLLDNCDLLVWVDPPIAVQMGRVVRRTVSRRWRRTKLWNGNVEGPLRGLLTDPDHIIRWAWRSRHDARTRVDQVLVERPDLPVVRLRSAAEIDRWLSGWAGGRPAPPR